MALIATTWRDSLYGSLVGKGFDGDSLLDLCSAIASGSVFHVVGKSFATVDAGSVPGTGAGTGIGVTGLLVANLASAIYAEAVSRFGQAGDSLQDLCDSIADVCVEQLGLATLVSSHSPVFAGSGTVTVGSIPVVGSGWSSAIDSEGAGVGFEGVSWPDMAASIGISQADEVTARGTGTVAITGSATGGPVVPGTGAGTGVIS